jgi:lipopolysaccharide transport system ATP-binding protein
MMGDHRAIVVDGLTKRYRLGEAGGRTLREALSTGVRRLARRRAGQERRDFWALDGVSFEVDLGQIVGVVGNNGAGKSTLLKILSRITEPTSGSARYQGRIGSLLEVGTGFHPELSGRDNIYLNGAILGMSRKEIARRFDEIVAFAETEAFIDTPVKRYSSGMYLRLAFAVAAHLDTEILFVDEVLAVGDVAFQKKCLTRMGEVAHGGRTVLFVSHNLTAVQSLCQRVIWLQGGKIAGDGPSRDVLSRYLRASTGFGSSTDRNWRAGEGPSGGEVEVRRACIAPIDGDSGAPIAVDTSFAVDFSLLVKSAGAPIAVSLQLYDERGLLIFDAGPPGPPEPWAEGMHRVRCEIPRNLLNDGSYRLGVEVREAGASVLCVPDLLHFDVVDSEAERHGWYGKWPGILRPSFAWTREAPPATDRACA